MKLYFGLADGLIPRVVLVPNSIEASVVSPTAPGEFQKSPSLVLDLASSGGALLPKMDIL